MEKKQHMRWAKRGAQMLLPRTLCATQRRAGQIHQLVALKIIAGIGDRSLTPNFFSGPQFSAINQALFSIVS
jgi:hypothetical protein